MSVIVNNCYLNNPATVSQYGTGKQSFTANAILAGNASSSTGALQDIGAGTANQVLQTGAPPGWLNQDQLGAWTYVTQVVASNQATVDFTSMTGFTYKVVISSIIPVTNAAQLQLLVSSNNGTSYDNAASNYAFMAQGLNDSSTAALKNTESSGNTSIKCCFVGISNTSFANNFEFLFIDPDTSLVDHNIIFNGKYNDSTNGSCVIWGNGVRVATQANNAHRFQLSSGNISSGTFTLYKLALS